MIYEYLLLSERKVSVSNVRFFLQNLLICTYGNVL